MNIWIALVGGIFLGWVIEWIIDWLFWRRGIAGFYANESDLRNELSIAEQQRNEAVDGSSLLRQQLDDAATTQTEVEKRLAETETRLAETETRLVEANARLAEGETHLAEANTLLTEADMRLAEADKRLVEADTRFTEIELSKATTEQQLEEALEAAKLAMQPRRDDLEQIDGIGRIYEQKLFDAGIFTFAHLAITPVARLREIIQPAAWQNLNFDSWIEQARKCAEVVIFDSLPYRLEEINGIGPVFAKRLNDQGIMTFYDLAHTPEKRLREIIPQRGGLKHDFAGWIREARAFVGLTTGDRPPLPLERIKGIGPVFATRLDLAGIHTFDDLANASESTLREAIGSRGVQVSNLPRWIEDARDEVIHAREARMKEISSDEAAATTGASV